MKKVFFIICFCLLLTGCGNKDKIISCSSESDQTEIGYNIKSYYDIYTNDNIVNKVEITQIIESKKKEILQSFVDNFDSQYTSNNKKYGGYSFKNKVKDNKLTSTLTINYDKMNLEKFVKDNIAMKEYVNDKYKITLDNLIKYYNTVGIVCEKKD